MSFFTLFKRLKWEWVTRNTSSAALAESLETVKTEKVVSPEWVASKLSRRQAWALLGKVARRYEFSNKRWRYFAMHPQDVVKRGAAGNRRIPTHYLNHLALNRNRDVWQAALTNKGLGVVTARIVLEDLPNWSEWEQGDRADTLASHPYLGARTEEVLVKSVSEDALEELARNLETPRARMELAKRISVVVDREIGLTRTVRQATMALVNQGEIEEELLDFLLKSPLSQPAIEAVVESHRHERSIYEKIANQEGLDEWARKMGAKKAWHKVQEESDGGKPSSVTLEDALEVWKLWCGLDIWEASEEWHNLTDVWKIGLGKEGLKVLLGAPNKDVRLGALKKLGELGTLISSAEKKVPETNKK